MKSTDKNKLAIPLPIKVIDAFKMIITYEKLPHQFKVNGANLTGLSFKREDLVKLLEIPEVKYVHFALGHHYKQKHPITDKELDHFTLVAFGLLENCDAVLADDLVFDYCDPCPDICPVYTEELKGIKEFARRELNGNGQSN